MKHLLQTEMTCNGEKYNLQSELNDKNIYRSRNIKLAECNLIGYIDFLDLLLGDHSREVSSILRISLRKEMLEKDWQGFVIVNLSVPKDEPNETVLVRIDKTIILEKFTRDFFIPLSMNTTTLKNFCTELGGYSKQASERAKQKNIRSAAEVLVQKIPTLSMEEAIEMIESKM